MFIISKKKDFYDGVAGTVGIDKTIIYNRNVIDVEEKDIPVFFKKKRFDINGTHNTIISNLSRNKLKKEFQKKYVDYSHFVVGFCGKLYVGWKLYSEEKLRLNTNIITEITDDVDFVNSLVESNKWNGNFVENVNKVKQSDAMQLFREFNSPIFLYDSNTSIKKYGTFSIKSNAKFFISPILADYEFFKVFNTFQAFQEIQMFLGGVLGSGEKEIAEVADKYKIQQYGFNKYSFRKEKQEKL